MIELGELGTATRDRLLTGASPPLAARAQCRLVQRSTTSPGMLDFDAETAGWVLDAARKLEALGALQRGWDSYGGLPLSPESKALTVRTLGWLGADELPVPAVVLGSEGNVHLEWRSKGKELEVELGSGVVDFVKAYPHGEIEEGRCSSNLFDGLRKLSRWLLHG